MFTAVVTILVSFFLTFAITIPFIKLLYRYNIRRIPKAELDGLLPGRQIKMGTPIMGGTVILASVVLLSPMLLNGWNYLPMIIIVSLLGGFFGAIDEYTNTLGRTIMAIRMSRRGSVFPTNGLSFRVKEILLTPWNVFKETLRIMGGEQKGLKNHYKFLMHVSLAVVVIIYLLLNNHELTINFPLLGNLYLGWFYYIFVAIMLFGFSAAFGVTDGMDGLSAGTHSIAFMFLGTLALYFGYSEAGYLAFIILGAELAFLYFNIHPARVEMSDVGTLPLGMLFVVIAVLIHQEVTAMVIGSIFIIEILSSVSQQWSAKLRGGKRIFLVAPIHHHFEKLGWPETKVTMRFWLYTVISGLIGIAIALA